MNKTKIHTIKMRLATISIKLMDLDNRIERATSQKSTLRSQELALKIQHDSMLEQLAEAEKSAAAAAASKVIIPQEPA
jgi:hypothetical protein